MTGDPSKKPGEPTKEQGEPSDLDKSKTAIMVKKQQLEIEHLKKVQLQIAHDKDKYQREREQWAKTERELESKMRRNWNEFTLERKKQSDCESVHIMD